VTWTTNYWRETTKEATEKRPASSNKLVMHSETLEEGPGESTGWKRLQHNSNRLQIQWPGLQTTEERLQKEATEKCPASSNKLVMHSETLAEGPGESTGWNAFNRTAIDCGIQWPGLQITEERLQVLRLPDAESFLKRNRPKTRYCGHTFSRLLRVWT